MQNRPATVGSRGMAAPTDTGSPREREAAPVGPRRSGGIRMAFSAAQGGSTRAAIRQMFSGTPGRVFLLLCLMYFITYVDRVNLSTVAPLLKAEFHLSNSELGLALSGFGYTYAMFQVLGGLAGDRFGPRRTLTVCGLVWALATIATGLVGGLASLIVVRLLLGLGEGATFPTATRAMSNWVAKESRGFAQGF